MRSPSPRKTGSGTSCSPGAPRSTRRSAAGRPPRMRSTFFGAICQAWRIASRSDQLSSARRAAGAGVPAGRTTVTVLRPVSTRPPVTHTSRPAGASRSRARLPRCRRGRRRAVTERGASVAGFAKARPPGARERVARPGCLRRVVRGIRHERERGAGRERAGRHAERQPPVIATGSSRPRARSSPRTELRRERRDRRHDGIAREVVDRGVEDVEAARP